MVSSPSRTNSDPNSYGPFAHPSLPPSGPHRAPLGWYPQARPGVLPSPKHNKTKQPTPLPRQSRPWYVIFFLSCLGSPRHASVGGRPLLTNTTYGISPKHPTTNWRGSPSSLPPNIGTSNCPEYPPGSGHTRYFSVIGRGNGLPKQYGHGGKRRQPN